MMRRVRRRGKRTGAARRCARLAVVLCATAARAASADPEPRNVLLIVADDVGVDQLGVYGEGPLPPSTPTLDHLAQRGVLFRNAWSNPVCSSTRATLLTGRYGFRTGVRWVASSGSELADREHTLPEMLGRHPRSRYRMAAFGKWHLHGREPWDFDEHALAGPVRAGFPYFFGTFQYIVLAYDHWRELEVMDLGGASPAVRHGDFSTTYNTTEIVDRAAAWIRAMEANHPGDPWFVWLSFNAGHSPFHQPPAELHTVDLADPAITCQNPYPYSEPDRVVPCYRAMVEAMDHELGRLLTRELSAESLQRTSIVFVGDNGTVKEASVAPFDPMHSKGTPYEGGINVPLIVSGAGVELAEGSGGRVSDALVNTTDLYATILELAGIDVARTVPAVLGSGRQPEPLVLDSISLLPILGGEERPAARRVFAYAELYNGGEGDPLWQEARAIRDLEGYKLIRFSEQLQIVAHDELYYLPGDPFELRNLLEAGPTPRHAAAHEKLSRSLDAMASTGWRPQGPPTK